MNEETLPPSLVPEIIQDFSTLYQSLSKDNLHRLSEVYSDDIVFKDAMHELEGIDALTEYFEGLYTNLTSCDFDIQHIQASDNGHAFLTWKMSFSHPQLGSGKNIIVDGATDLRFDQKITYHRDYIDMGQMLYEHIPVLGSVIRLVKKRAIS